MRAADTSHLAALVAERERVLSAVLEAEAPRIALACRDLARAFARGGTLIAYGAGAAATDAAHVAVEFVHPVIVGKRALPALAPAEPLRLARPGDVALAIAHGPEEPALAAFLRGARERGLLTIRLAGGHGGSPADHDFVVECGDERIVQEVQETLYHVLWELVHVFFEHPGLLDESGSGAGEAGSSAPGRLPRADGAACVTCGDVAVEADVVAVRNGTAVIEKDGAREEVAIDLVESVTVGDRLLCHAGVALEKL